MEVVLPSEESGYFSSGSLRRSHSQAQFINTPTTTSLERSYNPVTSSYSQSAPSTASSSPRTHHPDSADLSCSSTPASNFSLPYDFDDTLAIDETAIDDDFGFPSYKRDQLFLQPPSSTYDNLEPPPSPRTGDSYTPSPADYGSATDTPKPDTPECSEHAEDDTAVTTRPSRQVDYLSHEWREEDIWSSWRYIVSRRGEYPNSARLENASWRTWMKSKNNLSTVSPETLNWLKECDVTWLYGPLQLGERKLSPSKTESSSACLSKTNSFIGLHKKPILKKRSMSEVMLQRSLSTASLLKQATAVVQAQETKKVLRPSLVRSRTDFVTYPFSSRRMSHDLTNSSTAASTESSGITSPNTERKHIHFNEQVEQCIAVEIKGEDDDEVDIEPLDSDSDSDDGVVMKRSRSKKIMPKMRKKNRGSLPPEGRTIAMLPSTTLKYREDTPEPQETAMKHSRSPVLSPSSSQETLRPSRRSTRFMFGDDDDEEDPTDGFCDPNAGWRSPTYESGGGLQRSTSSGSLNDVPGGMRRTPSGMLMPSEEIDAATGDTIFGRVIDTVNTARDIAHVIWNVGWRK
ncbi:unnamed protein product [Clonostachys chloroleuca]|uniref:Nitrogen regulatory protein areA GATA-like domain-containing protein n=1 Tax=Clonostachys chloroleuca TaxID=1926264 RepID=A0AA35Q6S8_9HYPO|nr:unnamed protein product [Clonostachys chloroleuca]